MAYYITVKKNKEYVPLNISDNSNFERLSKYNGNKYSLEEIDNFTSKFGDEIYLRKQLYYEGNLSMEDITRELTIRIKNGDSYKKVMYDPIFREAKSYLDPLFLLNKMWSLSDDYDFLLALMAHYQNSYVNNETIASIRAYTLGNPELNINELLKDFLIREIYNRVYNRETNCYEEKDIKYKSLHDLAAFIYHYQHKNDPKMSKKEMEQELLSFVQELDTMLKQKEEIKDKPIIKKRVRRPLEGQTSMFDINKG